MHSLGFSRAIAMKDQTAQTVAKVLINHCVNIHRMHERIQSDQGRNSEEKKQLVHQLCDVYGSTISKTSSISCPRQWAK